MKTFKKPYLSYILLTSLVLVINGCAETGSDTSSSGGGSGGGGSSCSPGGTAKETYNISWDVISDPDGNISDYKVYYSANQNPVTKSNADGNFLLGSSSNLPQRSFNPGDYFISTCINMNFAVSSTNGTKESDISGTISVLIE